MLFTDGSKFGRGELLHMGLLGLRAFERREKRLPEPGNPEEAEEVVKLAEEVQNKCLLGCSTVLCRWGGGGA